MYECLFPFVYMYDSCLIYLRFKFINKISFLNLK